MKLEYKLMIALLACACCLLIYSIVLGRQAIADKEETKYMCETGKYCYDYKTAERKCKYIKELMTEEQCDSLEEIWAQ